MVMKLRMHGGTRCLDSIHAWAQVWSVAWQTDGSRLASASDDKSVALYNLA